MKLLYCRVCNDLFALHFHGACCMCGKSGGRYTDLKVVEYNGPAFIINFDTDSLVKAVSGQEAEGDKLERKGWPSKERIAVPRSFNAYVMPESSPNLIRTDAIELDE